jgi:hypothetical protein
MQNNAELAKEFKNEVFGIRPASREAGLMKASYRDSSRVISMLFDRNL